METECMFCCPELVPDQQVLIENEHCLFLQLEEFQVKGCQLEGSGLIIPRIHRETVFDMLQEEWNAVFTLLQEVKAYIDGKFGPDGYNLGWNCGEIGGQHVFHAHFHVLPRYRDEPLAGKGIRSMLKSKENERKSQ